MPIQSFLDQTFELIDDYLGDPHSTRRLTKAKKLRDLQTAEKDIWERLFQASGQEGSLSRTEFDVEIKKGKSFYLLPGNFRQFIKLERRIGGNRNQVKSYYPSIPMYHPGPGVEILNGERGMQIRPEPVQDSPETWTLIYEKGPIALHFAKAAGVGEKSLTAGTPESDAGDLILLDDFYVGCLIRVYDAGNGAAPQTREVEDYDGQSRTFSFRHPWETIPSGDVYYEVRPVLPPDYDHIYAIKVAMMNCTRRNQRGRKAELTKDYKEMWFGCLAYFNNNVSDRPPGRVVAYPENRIDPYEESFY